jgi:hypothetical protein
MPMTFNASAKENASFEKEGDHGHTRPSRFGATAKPRGVGRRTTERRPSASSMQHKFSDEFQMRAGVVHDDEPVWIDLR